MTVVSNPTAGRHGRRKIAAAVAHLESRGIRVSVRETQRKGDAELLARGAAAEHPCAVVAAGGDGTINEVMNGLVGLGVPLGVLPLGTANVFAREIGLPTDPARAAEVVAQGRTTSVHVGTANNRHFLLMAGVGFDAQVVYELPLALKSLLGRLAYVLTGLRVLAFPPRQPLEVDLGGEVVSGFGVIVGNARHYGGPFQVTPLAGLQLPELDVCIFTRPGSLPLFRYLSAVASGNHLSLADVAYRKSHNLVVRSAKPLHVQADGDLFGKTPLEFRVTENALSVLVPAGPGPRPSPAEEKR